MQSITNNNNIVYLDEGLKETKIVMENGAMKLYVPPEYLMILMTKRQSWLGADYGITLWERLKLMMDEYVGENFENAGSEIMYRIIEFLNNIYRQYKTELNVMKTIKENL